MAYIRWIYLKRIFISKEHLQPYIWAVPSFIQEATCSDLIFLPVLFFFKLAFAVIHWVNSIKSSCSHPFDELPFSYYKRVIATTHSFTFTVFLQNWSFSKGILTIILIPPWFQACIYWKNFVIRRHHLQPSIFSMIVSLYHGSTWSNPHVKETVFLSQYFLQPSIIINGLRLIREKVEEDV